MRGKPDRHDIWLFLCRVSHITLSPTGQTRVVVSVGSSAQRMPVCERIHRAAHSDWPYAVKEEYVRRRT